MFLEQLTLEKIKMSRAESEIEPCYDFWLKYNKLGLICWVITPVKITIEFCFNDECINIDNLLLILNKMVEDSPLPLEKGWKPNFTKVVATPEEFLQFCKTILFVLIK